MSRLGTIDRKRALGAAGLLLGLLLLAATSPVTAATFAPAALLFALLTRSVRPGERLIQRLVKRARGVVRRVRTAVAAPALPVVVRPVGVMLAAALAMRPPPRARAAVSS